jgi:hypothetical protein
MAPFSAPASATPQLAAAPPKKEAYMLQLLEKANALPDDEMASLQQQEREIRDEIEKNPSRKAYWELLSRMVLVSGKNLSELYRRYDMDQKWKEREAEMKRMADKAKKREEAAQLERMAEKKKKDEEEVRNVNPQTNKRAAKEALDDNRASKKVKRVYVPRVQRRGEGIEENTCGAKFCGDWKCMCGYWSRGWWEFCDKCHKPVEDCWDYTAVGGDGEGRDGDLPFAKEKVHDDPLSEAQKRSRYFATAGKHHTPQNRRFK